MIRFDMSEYQTIADISRLIGSQNGDPGQLVTQIRENPFSLVLFDEIEKAHASILNLFLQVLDEGWLTDAWGRKVSFRNCIIIATSNAGAELIREMVSSGSNQAVLQEKILDFVQREGIFKPELLNRFDGLTVFHSLSHENLVKIAELLLGGLAQRLAEQEIQFVATPALAEKIANLGYAPEFGARPMRRVIQDRVEDLISQRILSGQIQKGQTIEIRPEEI
jgi:ATP-dependent Clp protease ATP-binding subunit ClpC